MIGRAGAVTSLSAPMRLIVARCTITYTGRLETRLESATRLLMIKADGTLMVWSDHGSQSVKPLNWMTPPTVIEESPERLIVRKRAGASEDRLEIELEEVLSDITHDMGSPDADTALSKDGVEAHLQELLAAAADLVRRGAAAGQARVAHRHRPGRPDVPRRVRRLGRGRDQARRRDRRGRAADAATWSGSGSIRRSANAAGVLAAQ